MNQDGTRGAIAAVAPRPTAAASMKTRVNFAVYHLQAAEAFAKEACDLELQQPSKSYDASWTPMFWHASSAVVMAVAAQEAAINEVIRRFIDAEKEKERREALTKLLRRGLLCKCEKIAASRGNKLNKGLRAYGDLKVLTMFRDELVHFKPEWHDEKDFHKRVEDALSGKVVKKPALEFPMNYLSGSTAKWAIDTVRAFSCYYSKLLEVEGQLS